MKTTPVCSNCGSPEVRRDAWASWDHEPQAWTLGETYDQAWCNACEGETTLEWKELTPFVINYRLWLDDCLREYNDKYPPRKFHQADERAVDCEAGEFVEFSEYGDAYPHGIGGTGHIRAAVTPWYESPHHLHWFKRA